MKKIFPLVASIAIIMLAGAFASVGILAQFSDTETIDIGDIQAGTLNLKVGDNDPSTVHITISNIAPGWSKLEQFWLTNTGSIDGTISVEFSAITNYENGRNEPELAVDGTGGNPGPGNGELGAYLKAKAAWYDDPSTITAFIGPKLNDIGGNTYTTSGKFALLEAGETQSLKMLLELPSDTGNVVQSDSVEFDIIFNLVQAP